MFKPSKYLSESENRELDIYMSLLKAAPLLDADYTRYVELCKKARREPLDNW